MFVYNGSLWVMNSHMLEFLCLTKILPGVNGFCILAIAVGSLICNTLAVKVGKRPIYLATTIGLAVSCFWAAESRGFASLCVARMSGFSQRHSSDRCTHPQR